MIRRALGGLALVVVTLGSAAACNDDDRASRAVPSELLQVEDLPAEPASQSIDGVDQPPPLSTWCSLEFAGIYGPGFDIAGVEYEGVAGATITNTVNRLPGTNLTADRLDQMRDQVEGCLALNDSDPPLIEILDSPADTFVYATFDEDGNQTGGLGFALIDQAYVSVAVVDNADINDELLDLLETAIQRATT